jgi:high-affinity iron transporter
LFLINSNYNCIINVTAIINKKMSFIYDTLSSVFNSRDLCASDDCIVNNNSGGGGGATLVAPLVDIAIITIFAREILEGCIIIGNYRTVIKKSPDFQDPVKQATALRTVTVSALWASLAAVVLAASLALGLFFAGKGLNKTSAEIIEGVSKVVAAVCVLQLSGKIPKWLGLYANKKDDKKTVLEMRSIKFNVAWNLWREVAECGVFLIPYMLGSSARSIPVSAVIGTVVGFAGGFFTYWASLNMKSTVGLAFFLANLTGWLAVGLFVGGMHYFELVLGKTPEVWYIDGEFWAHNRFPMVMLKVFGYTHKRTVLQIVCFWFWVCLTFGYHYYKFIQSEKIFEKRRLAKDVEAGSEEDCSEESQIHFENTNLDSVNKEVEC